MGQALAQGFSSALAAGRCYSPDESLLGHEEKDNDGEDRDGARRHQVMPLHAAVLRLVALERDREGVGVLPGQVEEWPEEIIPREDEMEEGCDDQHRRAERHDDPPEDAPLAAAVNAGRLAQFLRDGPEELPHEEDIEG